LYRLRWKEAHQSKIYKKSFGASWSALAFPRQWQLTFFFCWSGKKGFIFEKILKKTQKKKMSNTANSCSNSNWTTAAVSTLATTTPTAISTALSSANVDACFLSPQGECNQSGCDLSKKSSASLDCNCLTFFANMNAGVYSSMNCLLSSATASTSAMVVSNQTININIISSGDITNASINNTQGQAVQVTTMTLTDSQNQQSLANIATSSIKAILYDAGINPNLYSDNVSTQIIRAFQQYLATNPQGLNDIVNANTVSTIKAMTQVNYSGSNIININIIDSSWAQLKINLNQQTVVSLVAQTIASNVCKAVTNGILADTVNSALASIVPVCGGASIPIMSSDTPSSSPSLTLAPIAPAPPATQPSSSESSTGFHKIVMIIIILIVLFIAGYFVYYFVNKNKKQPLA
jgi:hypothetical protein